jgi:hypothetical protein
MYFQPFRDGRSFGEFNCIGGAIQFWEDRLLLQNTAPQKRLKSKNVRSSAYSDSDIRRWSRLISDGPKCGERYRDDVDALQLRSLQLWRRRERSQTSSNWRSR